MITRSSETRPVSTRVVNRAAGLIANRFGRRGFIAGSAVTASALASNPVAYALQPVSAYQAICSCNGSSCPCGSLCCDGYTEFCCTLSGHNTCPPGTILGGWWKVDGTSFCSGPRYYMDCNTPCGSCSCGANGVCTGACSGTPCGCAQGDCNNRKAGCTEFRYGQCNQNIACIGPIVCRVVTCVPPWAIDATCTTTVRVDNNTAGHDRPCLHAVIGNLDSVEAIATTSGRSVRVRGWALDFDVASPVTVRIQVDGVVVTDVVADKPRADVAAAFPGWGDRRGFDVTIPVAGGAPRSVCTTALNVGAGTTNAALGCRDVFTRTLGHVDSVDGGPGTLRVRGWAILIDHFGPLDVRVLLDGVHRATARADVHRADVGAAHPEYGSNRGFDITIEGLEPRSYTACVEVVASGPEGNPLLECRSGVAGGLLGFPDVSVNNIFADQITWLVESDIAAGYADGTFRPTSPVSRQAMAAFLFRYGALAGAPAPPAPTPQFDDVGPGDPFHAEIGWLAATGIAEGFADNTFRPTQPVSRQAMAAFILRFAHHLGAPVVDPGNPTFTDVGPDHPFAEPIAWMASVGIATGFNAGEFLPGRAVSRQAMAAFLRRFDDWLS